MKSDGLKRMQRGCVGRTLMVCIVIFLSVSMALLLRPGYVSAQTITKTVKVGDNPRGIGMNLMTRKKYVVDYNDNAISVLGVNDSVIKTFLVGSSPIGIAVDEVLNKIYVTNWLDDNVSVIDGNADSVVKTIAVGRRPEGAAVNPRTHQVYVANSWDDTVSVINSSTDTISKTITVGDDPREVAVNPLTNRVYVTQSTTSAITVIDGGTDSVIGNAAIPGDASDVCANPETDTVYVSGTASASDTGAVWVLDGSTNTLKSTIEVSSSPVVVVAMNPATNRIYACNAEGNRLAVINGAAGVLRSTLEVGEGPYGIGVDPKTDKVYVSNCEDDTVSIIHDPPGDSFYFAEGTTRPGFDPYICIQNMGAEEARVTVTYMPGEGAAKEQKLKIPPRSRATVHPADVLGTGDDAAHDFSARVVCTNGQKIVAERPMYFNYKGAWAGGHNVMGATGAYAEVYFAEATTRAGFEPYVCVMNPSYDPTHVEVYGTATCEAPVAPRSRATVSGLQIAEANQDFGVKVQSVHSRVGVGQKVIAERPMYFNYNGWAGGSDVVGIPLPGHTFYFAEGTTRPGFDSYLCILAPGPTARVKVTFMLGDGTTREQETEFGGRLTINCRDVLGTGDDAAHDFSAKVESLNGQPIVAERPMYFNYKGVWAGGHDVIGTALPSGAFSFAEGCARPGFHTYFCIQNPTGAPAEVKITYMKGDGTTAEQSLAVGSNSRYTVSCHDFLGSSDDEAHDFSARVECTNGQQIVVERPMYFNYRGVWAGGHNVMGYQE